MSFKNTKNKQSKKYKKNNIKSKGNDYKLFVVEEHSADLYDDTNDGYYSDDEPYVAYSLGNYNSGDANKKIIYKIESKLFQPKFIISNENLINNIYFWKCLSGNPNAIQILEDNLDKVDWEMLSENPNAVHILKKKYT